MRVPAPGMAGGARAPQCGFSLLELLVALFVIVLVTSLVTLNIGAGDRDILLEAELRNLAEVGAYALDEAQFVGLDYGLLLQQVEKEGEWRYAYAWRERRPGGWQLPATGKDVFQRRRLPEDVDLFLELEDGSLAEIGQAVAGIEATPQVVLFASGETTPGAIEVRRRQGGELLWRLEWDLLGRFTMLQRGEEEDESR